MHTGCNGHVNFLSAKYLPPVSNIGSNELKEFYCNKQSNTQLPQYKLIKDIPAFVLTLS